MNDVQRVWFGFMGFVGVVLLVVVMVIFVVVMIMYYGLYECYWLMYVFVEGLVMNMVILRIIGMVGIGIWLGIWNNGLVVICYYVNSLNEDQQSGLVYMNVVCWVYQGYDCSY